MNFDQSEAATLLGSCPDCGETIQHDQLLATYKPPDNWPTTLAQCPDCQEIIHPE